MFRKGGLAPEEAAKLIAEGKMKHEGLYDWKEDFSSMEEYRSYMNRLGIELYRIKAGESLTKEKFLIQAVLALEELQEVFNLEVERLREWFGYHYPEYKEKKHERFVKAVQKAREEFDNFSGSVGVPMDEKDREAFLLFSGHVLGNLEAQKGLEKYVDRLMEEVAPNTKDVLGPLLGAKIISMFGSLERMAKAPSSAIQLIGAEKSLFRHLKSGKKAKPPKYGLIYRHPRIQSLPQRLRGRAARIIASKASMAARIDFFSGKRNPEIREKLEAELRRLVK